MEPNETLDPALFRRAMGRWPTGVAVLTTGDSSGPSGMTINALLSVALEPPTLLVSLGREADSTPKVDAAGRFAVHFLSAEQRPLSERFAKVAPAAEKFAGLSTRPGLGGIPLLEGATAVLECVVRSSFDAEDHRLFLGEVVRVHLGPDAPPLLFFHSQYAAAEPSGRLQLPAPRA